MSKDWWKSKTVWGAVFIAISMVLPVMFTGASWLGTVQGLLDAVGSFLGITGIRTAIAANGNGS